MNYHYQQQQQQQQQAEPAPFNSLLSSVNQAIQSINQHQPSLHQSQFSYYPQLPSATQPHQSYPFHYHPIQQNFLGYNTSHPSTSISSQFHSSYYTHNINHHPTRQPTTTIDGYTLSSTAFNNPTSTIQPSSYPTSSHQNFHPPQPSIYHHHHPFQHHHSGHQPKRIKAHHNQPHERFPCDVCQEVYYNLMDLSIHLRNHIKCDYQDCQFEAIPSVLDIHKEDRHLIFKPGRSPKPSPNRRLDGPINATIQGLGYALKTQEQIDQWIQERKKKWPTTALVSKKLAEAEERKKAESLESNSLSMNTSSTNLPNRNFHNPNRSRNGYNSRYKFIRSLQPPTKEELGVKAIQGSHESKTDDCTVTPEDGLNQDLKVESSGSDMDSVKDAISSKMMPPIEPMDPTSSSLTIVEGNTQESDKPSVVEEDPKESQDRHPSQLALRNQTDDHGVNDPSSIPQNSRNEQHQSQSFNLLRGAQRHSKGLSHHPPRSSKSQRHRPIADEQSVLFDRSGLFSKLIEKDLEQDVNDLFEVIKFLNRNEYLIGYQLEISDDPDRITELE